MVEKMTKYSFVLLSSDKDAFLASLRTLGVVDVTRADKPVDAESARLLSEVEGLRLDIKRIESGSDDTTAALLTSIARYERLCRELEVWGDYDREKLLSLGVPVHFYSVRRKDFDPSWASDYPVQIVSDDKDSVRFVLLSDDKLPVKEMEAPSLSLSEATSLLSAKRQELSEYQDVLISRRGELPQLYSRLDTLRNDFSAYLASLASSSTAEGVLSIFVGFAPSGDEKKLADAFDTMDCVWFSEPACASDNPPIKLRNNRFSKLFEVLTGMYGMPVYDEFDPTPVLSIFFMLFFAMCMGDAGYGLVLILFGTAVRRRWVNIEMFRNIGPLITVLGVATFVVGFFLGTFFGILLPESPWVPDILKKCMVTGKIAGYDIQMVLALAVGVFHICLAMCIKTACYVKRFGLKDNLSTCGWTLLIVGGVIIAALALMNVLPETALKVTVICIAVLSCLGIFIFNKPGRNPLLNIGAGLWDTYQMATGLLGDVLSYIRLYALGLAGGMLGSAFNDLGNMVLGPDPLWQWIPFVLIVVVGHVLNLLMSCLGAFVHPLRLSFVEYFKNSGYEGKGLKYNPLK